MKIKRIALASLPLLLTASFASNAADALFRPRASVGFASYELEFLASGSAIADSSYMTGGFGATIAKDNIYFDAAYTTSLSATYDNSGTDDDFTRTDLNFTVGLALDGGLSVFAGYKTGESAYSSFVGVGEELRFEASGLFFGAGFSNNMENSSISFNAAIAFLEGELTDDDTSATPYNATADTIGFSFGLGYNYYINNDSGFGLKGTVQVYDFVDWVDPVYTISDTAETLVSVEASYFVNF